MIRKLCYELYKVDWKRDHMITTDIEMDSIKDYYEVLIEYDADYTYEEYLNEFGYEGELYVCYEEFLDTEYQDISYIRYLLDNEELISLYYQDINSDEE